MLIDFFLHLKARKLPVSTREFLTVLEGLRDHVCGPSIDEFYFIARSQSSGRSTSRPGRAVTPLKYSPKAWSKRS